MIFVIAKSVLVDEAAKAAFIEAYKENLPNVLAEKGCIRYDLAEDFNSGFGAQEFNEPNTVTFVEAWESIEDLENHLKAPHMDTFRSKIGALRKSSSLQVMSPVK